MNPMDIIRADEIKVDSIGTLEELGVSDGTPLDSLEDAFLILAASQVPNEYQTPDGTRSGFITRFLVVTDPYSKVVKEVYSHSDKIAEQARTMLENGLSPEHPVICRFESIKTKMYTVHKLVPPSDREVTSFKEALKGKSK